MRHRRHKEYDAVLLRGRILAAFDQRDISPDHTASEHWYRRVSTSEREPSVTTRQSLVKGYKQWAVDRSVEYFAKHAARYVAGDGNVLNESRYEHVEELAGAASVGTAAHEAYDRYLTAWIEGGDKRPDYSCSTLLPQGASGMAIAACRSFDKFLDENEVVPVFSEIRVWSRVDGVTIAGSVDWGFILRSAYEGRGGSGPRCTGTGPHDYSRQESGSLWCCICDRETIEQFILGDHKTSNSISGKAEYAEQTEAYAKGIEAGIKQKFDGIWVIRYSKEKAEYEIQKVCNRKKAWERFKTIARAFDSRVDNSPLLESVSGKRVVML